MNSPEYPDLRWVSPRSWSSAGRSSVQLVVIHTTEGSAHAGSAEDGAAYDQRRTDGTSAHVYVDSDSVVQCVRTADVAHTARFQGNRRGIQFELCGRAGWSASTWAGEYAQAMLRQAARVAARVAREWKIPVVKLSPAQVAAGAEGFCGHYDITRAFPADGGDHTDPGPDFPWATFLGMVRDELEEDDLPSIKELTDELKNDRSEYADWSGKRPWRQLARTDMSTLAVLNGTYDTARAALSAITANAAAEAQRDAAQSAVIAGLSTAVQSIASARGVLTDAQVVALTETVRQAAATAGAQATAAVEAKLDSLAGDLGSLRGHLGDVDPTVPLG